MTKTEHQLFNGFVHFENRKDEETEIRTEGYYMTLDYFKEFGEPEVITLSVEPGDLLNPIECPPEGEATGLLDAIEGYYTANETPEVKEGHKLGDRCDNENTEMISMWADGIEISQKRVCLKCRRVLETIVPLNEKPVEHPVEHPSEIPILER